MHPATTRRVSAKPRQTWTVRLSMWSARHPRSVLIGWLLATIGVFALSLAIGGTRAVSAFGSSGSQTEAQQADQAMQSGVHTSKSEELDLVVTSSTLKATDPAFRSAVERIEGQLTALTVSDTDAAGAPEIAGRPAVSGVADPYAAPLQAGLLAPDLTSVRIVGTVEGSDTQREVRTRALANFLATIQAANPAYEIHAYSTTLASDEAAAEINQDMDGTILISLPATFLILLLAFGALVAAGVPLVMAITALLGAFGLFGIFSQLVEPVSPFAAQFIVLIGLAVAVDYSLFTITRYRSERRSGLDKLAAIEAASATSGRAVLFSGMAVMISLAGLFLLPDPLFQSIAVGTIAVIAVSVVGSVFFLPAVLALLGDGIDRGRLPLIDRIHGRGEGVWARIVRGVMSRPVGATVVAAAALLTLASPVTRLNLGEADITILPDRVDAVRAFEALQAHWPQGSVVRMNVAVVGGDSTTRMQAAQRLQSELATLAGLGDDPRISQSPDGSASVVSVAMGGSSDDSANWRLVGEVRSQVVPAALASCPQLRAYVGGDAASAMDNTQIYSDGMARVLLFVLGFSFVLLLLVFHSIAIPLKAILLNLLATAAAFGSMVLVFQEGWFGSLLGVQPISSIQNFVPVFVFTVLFGLSMDYEVFILSRVKEAYDQGLDSREAVARGISLTAGTVTSAAAIMVVVFAIFVTLPLAIARELGLGLAVAVFVDATLIRCVLLPATMRLLGDWNWWLPGALRWLPRISIEAQLPAMPAVHPAPGSNPRPQSGLAAEPALSGMLPSGTTGLRR